MFTKAVVDHAKLHALREYPKESCGVVVGGDYHPCTNVAENPEKDFKIEESQLELKEKFGSSIQAVVHSHPDSRPSPSSGDMISQIESAVPWAIVSTDGINAQDLVWFGDECPTAELLGRPFIHGVYDCYGLVRDFYRVRKGILLPQFVRDDQWWYNGEDLLNKENFESAGFREVSKEEVKKGDVVAAMIRANVVNHVGIYMGEGIVMHHLYDRLSRREPIGPWMRFCRHFLRYEE